MKLQNKVCYQNRVYSLLFFLIAFNGFAQGQTFRTVKSGFSIRAVKVCDKCIYGNGNIFGQVICNKCVGVSNDALWRNPCKECGNSRRVQKVISICPKCKGTGKFYFGPRLQVADTDFPNQMSWAEAKEACQLLGNGWRLPTLYELSSMYLDLHQKGKGNFTNSEYWSISDGGKAIFFGDGDYYDYSKEFDGIFGLKVRAVRNAP